MSIADKLIYLNETKQLLREAINAAGGNITAETPFREYAEQVEYVAWLQSGGPLNLFANGEQGAWYDPSDLSTLFQDAAGTIPVTSPGDPVGLMLDKSGNGNHASQSVSASRPTYQSDGSSHWVQLDGIDDYFDIPPLGMALSEVWVGASLASRNNALLSSGGLGYVGCAVSGWYKNNSGALAYTGVTRKQPQSVYLGQSGALLYAEDSTGSTGSVAGRESADAIYLGSFNAIGVHSLGRIYGLIHRNVAPSEEYRQRGLSYLSIKAGL